MKKNTMMRIASCLLIAVLMTTCVISGTFAKYVTTASGEDNARVAKWGFEAPSTSIDIDELFNPTYINDEVNGGSADIVAPGTTNSASFSFVYDKTSNSIAAPEVAYNFEVAVVVNDAANYAALDANKAFTWTLARSSASNPSANATIGTYQSIADLVDAIEKLDGADNTSQNYAPNALPSYFANGDDVYTITWDWAFEVRVATEAITDGDYESTPGATYAIGDIVSASDYALLKETSQAKAPLNDATDTAMGNADTLDNFSIKITVTATQIDTYDAP